MIFSLPPSSGSSPRMRGTLQPNGEHHQQLGIIPAYAGNTQGRRMERRRWRDHPRVCGEHCRLPEKYPPLAGSSPRMRGTHRLRHGEASSRGIIPAYAGNTLSSRKARRTFRDHPRVCGEHPVFLMLVIPRPGSSPRMRGTH